jgi:hypothetical protein
MEEDKTESSMCMPPYTSDKYGHLAYYSTSAEERDAFSIGIMILEIIVGTKLVMLAHSYDNLK